MENQRLFIFIALVFLGMLLYQEWQRDYGTDSTGTTSTATSPANTDDGATSGAVPAPAVDSTSSNSDVPAPAAAKPVPKGPTISGENNQLPTAQRIHVRTDVLDVMLDTRGGDIRQVDLVKFPQELDQPDKPIRLLTDQGAKFFVAQSGFSMVEGEGPTHEAVYRADQAEYALSEGKDSVVVRLEWSGDNQTRVIKTYTFKRGSYLIDMDVEVINGSNSSWRGSQYKRMQRTQYGQETQSMFVMQTYMGGVIYTPEELYEKISFSDMQDSNLDRQNIKGGWTAMMQHYFLGAWIPPQDSINNFYTRVIDYRYHMGMTSALQTIAPGDSKTFSSDFYIGPKDQNKLETIAPGLELTVDYGFLTVIAKPLFWLLDNLNKVFSNWGWSIIFLTVIIKLVFYKLSETSYRSMAKMRKVQPRMQALKEKFGDDKQQMNKALFDLYKKEKINPLSGCLPILIQIPVFIALYWVLLEAVELRQAPFILWIDDLSAKDPYYVLPLLMGASMWFQQKLNPTPLDPIQAKVMMALPIVFTVFFLFFPSGLVLYWVVNNTLSIAQQWMITKRIEAAK